MRRLIFGSVLAMLVVAVAACDSGGLDPLPLQVGVVATPTTAAPGDSVSFVVTAQGGNLIGVEVDYGDMSGDVRATSGARTARVTFRHAFKVSGTYPVRVTVTDAVAKSMTAGVDVLVK